LAWQYAVDTGSMSGDKSGMIDLTEASGRDHGAQPLDTILQRWGLTNAQLVAAASEQLTHKQVQRARKGRQLTLRMMIKLTRLLNEVIAAGLPEEKRKSFTPYLHRDLFTYAKGYDAARPDPNTAIIEEV
jgi:hypothetical protein